MNSLDQAQPSDIQEIKQLSEDESAQRLTRAQQELTEFSTLHQLPDLAARVRRGLDPIGILALSEYRQSVADICQSLGTTVEALTKLVVDIQRRGPWNHAEAFAEASDPVTQAWIVLSAADDRSRPREMDLTPEEFLKELDNVREELARAQTQPAEYFTSARDFVLADTQAKFRLEDDVPISEIDTGFIAMAVHGYTAGIIHDGDGMLFVGMKEPHDEVLQAWGLHAELRDDRGRSNVTFWVNEQGQALVKQLFPGFLIILSRSFVLAKALVRATLNEHPVITPEALGHTVYEPTSLQKLGDRPESPHIKTSRRIPEQEPQATFRDEFFAKLSDTKAQVILRDRFKLFRQKKAKKHEKITNEDLNMLAQLTVEKVKQKMDELKYMMDTAGSLLDALPPGMKIMDMAGGAGDLALAITMELMTKGKSPKGAEVVDPFVGDFGPLIIERLPQTDEFKRIVQFLSLALQEAKITPDAVVVAKHACGDLTDSIIEQWVNSESPALVIMTCCQDKAKDQPARYNLSQEEWSQLCRDSAKTNSPQPAQRAQGMAAMTKLDEARVTYLRRHGFEASLTQTDQFPKGDVIIARRKVSNQQGLDSMKGAQHD